MAKPALSPHQTPDLRLRFTIPGSLRLDLLAETYEWAIAEGVFRPRKPYEARPEFIGRFTSASMDHHDYEDGRRMA
jgi:hypothetical protein